jgi:hypothetical protein
MPEYLVRAVITSFLLAILLGVSMSPAAGSAEVSGEAGLSRRAVKRQIAARAGAFVNIRNLVGVLEVEGWDRGEVSVEGTIGPGVEELRLESDGQRVWLEVRLKGEPGTQHGEAEILVRVPSRSRLKVRTVDAFSVLRGLQGFLDFESVTGDLRLEEGRLQEIIATTVSGSLVFAAPALRLQVRSVSGMVRIEREVEDLVVRTGDGTVELLAQVVREARLESVSGRILVKAPVADEGRLQVFVHDGQAELLLPPDLAAAFHLETVRGTLKSDFGPPLPIRQKDRRQGVRFRTGSGRARVEARSISGSLHLVAHPSGELSAVH